LIDALFVINLTSERGKFKRWRECVY